MSTGKLALALWFSLAACGDGGGGGGGDEETCPGTSDVLVGACHEADGSCREYRGAIEEADARDDCTVGDGRTFRKEACPAGANLRGSCSAPPAWDAGATGTVVAFEPRAEGYRFKVECIVLGACYDPTGRDDDACYGTDDVLVGSCLHENGTCLEYRGGIDRADARGQCEEGPASAFREAACPASAREGGSCSGASDGGTIVLFHEDLFPEEMEQLCADEHACYQAP